MSIQTNFPAIKPTLLLDFANTKQLDSRITFTRASTATYYGTQTAKAEENLLLQSQDFTTTWINVNSTDAANTSTAPDGTTTADTLTDDATSGTHSTYQSVSVLANTTYVVSCFMKAGTNNFGLLSFTDAASAQRYFAADFNLSTGTVRTSAAGSSGTITSATITDAGNGWYRCVIIGQAAAVGSNRIYVGVSDGTSSLGNFGINSYIGTGTTIFAWGAQLEQRSAATAYTPTTTETITNYIPQLLTAASGVARFDHNPTTFESLGLLIEESRTNLVTYSSEFDNAAWTKTNATITANTIISPDGSLNADSISETTATGSHRARTASISVSASTSYTCTVFAKLGFGSVRYLGIGLSSTTDITTGSRRSYVFDLSNGTATTTGGATWTAVSGSATAVGNGWYRCQMTVTTDAAASTMFVSIGLSNTFSAATFASGYTGDGYSGIYIWGAQLETGAFPTSYIPTVASQVTRAADAASMTGTNFSSWYNQAEGTFFAQFIPASSSFGANKNLFLASDGTVNNYAGLRYTGSGAEPTFSVVVAGTAQAAMSTGTMVAGTSYKMAGAYEANDFAVTRNAGTVETDTSGTVPVVTQAEIGMLAGTSFSTQTISKLAYYPLRVTNAQLQGLTS
jgi:hypothetical protein